MEIVKKETLLKVLDDARDIYVVEGASDNVDAIKAITKVTELSVVDGSIESNMGDVDVAYSKTTDGTIVAAKFTKGDPTGSFQVYSIDHRSNQFFANAVHGDMGEVTVGTGAGAAPVQIRGYENKLLVKKATIIMTSADHTSMIAFPNAQVSANFVPTGGGDANTGYWNVSFVPLPNKAGSAFYLSDGYTDPAQDGTIGA